MPRNEPPQKKRGKRRKRKPMRKRGRQVIPETEMQFLRPTEADIMKLLAAQTHVGRRRAHVNMKRYIWKRRQDGVHVINLEKTWAKVVLAARILVTVLEPKDIVVMSTRNHGQRGAIKFAHYTGATALVGKWVPGTFTNPQNKVFHEPRVVLVDDPSTCFAALRETSYIGVPVIAFCGVDNNTRFVDCAIPCNNRGNLSVGLMFWLLTRELLTLKGDVTRGDWTESVDLFFHRDAGEIKRQQEAKLRREQKKRQQEITEQYERQQFAGQEYAMEQQQQAQAEAEPQQEQQMGQFQEQQQQFVDQQSWEMPQPQQPLENWAGQQGQVAAPPVMGQDDVVQQDNVQYYQQQGQQQGQNYEQQQPPQAAQQNYEQQYYDPNAPPQIPTVPW